MKNSIIAAILLLACPLVHLRAQTGSVASTQAPPAPPKSVHFQDPDDDSGGVLPNRVAGGSRGGPADAPTLEVLVPDHVALTTHARPSLYWYQSKACKVACEVGVTEPKKPKPLLLYQTDGSTSAGVHAFRLSKFEVELKPSILYRWSVAVIVDPKNRSQDVVAYGVIKRIELSPEKAKKLAETPDQDKPAFYAENGIWYDALQSLTELINKDPKNAALLQERQNLLKQVGLSDAKFVTE